MLELLLVDDHTIFLEGIARLVSDEPDLCVKGKAHDGHSALELIRSQRYDVVLMDINMGVRSGLDTLATLRSEFPRLPVIMLSMYLQAQYGRRALRAGANAYLSKDVRTDELLHVIRHVAKGKLYCSPDLPVVPPEHARLSPREMQVLVKIAHGVRLTDIASDMCVSVKTIGSHRAHILEKLGLASNAELVQYAMRERLLD
jgi:DNA-binding NarL/FixJ family response regulator